MENKSQIVAIKEEINRELADPQALASLVNITFKGLTPELAKRALLEGMITGFSFKDFLQKNVYAIPFGQGYSLVGSIDHCRKIGMRSGVVGINAPIYTEDEKGNIITCEVTVKKKVSDYVGDFTALVYFKEFNTGRNQWAKMPRVMIAKVAEMHALRKACPEELSQIYSEEESEKEKVILIDEEEKKVETKNEIAKRMGACKDLKSLQAVWSSISGEFKADMDINQIKEDLKAKFINAPVEGEIIEQNENN